MKTSPNVQRKELQVRHWTDFGCFYELYFSRCICTELMHLLFLVVLAWKYLVKPRRGDALLFFSLYPTAIPDTSSLHAGCPVIEGEKWSATKWIHVDSFNKNLEASGNCTDMNESCQRWAALGECIKNPEYMVGSLDLPGYCRRSCKVC